MNLRRRSFGRIPVAAVLLLIIGLPASGTAQTTLAPGQGFEELPRIGIGYVANAPNMFAGGNVYGMVGWLGGVGLYLDAKLTPSSPADESDFVDSLSVADVNEIFPNELVRDSAFDRLSINAALVKTVTPELMVYLGGGYTDEETYRRFGVPDEDIGEFGFFWVHDAPASGGRINIMGGAFFRMGRHIALQFGVESAPRGFTVGASYSFSLR